MVSWLRVGGRGVRDSFFGEGFSVFAVSLVGFLEERFLSICSLWRGSFERVVGGFLFVWLGFFGEKREWLYLYFEIVLF